MSTITNQLIEPKQAEATQVTQYTSDSGTKTVIDKFTGTNTSAGAVTISVNLVPSGGTAGVSNLIVKTRNLTAGETYTFPELTGQVLEAGGFISTIASAATSITITSSGRRIVQ